MTDEQQKAITDAHMEMWKRYCAMKEKVERLHEVNAELVEALYNLRWAASERDKKNRIRQFDDFMDAADAALAKAQGENND